jgi:hypothetical protein
LRFLPPTICNNRRCEFTIFNPIMSLYGKTTFDRACTASSKSSFSDLRFKAPYVPNKPLFFPVGKNHSKSNADNSSMVCDANRGDLYVDYTTTPPPPN